MDMKRQCNQRCTLEFTEVDCSCWATTAKSYNFQNGYELPTTIIKRIIVYLLLILFIELHKTNEDFVADCNTSLFKSIQS